jgi:hypothetical protein
MNKTKDLYMPLPSAVETIAPILDERESLPVQKELSDTDQKVNQLATVDHFPNLTWEILNCYLNYQESQQKKLTNLSNDASHINQKINNLTELRSKLPNNEKSVELSESAQLLVKDLEKEGISLLQPNEKTISSARMEDLKTQIDAERDRLKSELNILFSSKMPVLIKELQSIEEVVRAILKSDDRMKETCISNQRNR